MSLEAILKAKLTDAEIQQIAAKLQEISSDNVIKAEIIKQLMWKKTSLIAIGLQLVETENTDVLDSSWEIPNLEAIEGEFPIPLDAVASRSAPVPYIPLNLSLEMAEYRFAVLYSAKAKGKENWQIDAQTRAGAEWFKRCVDANILDALYAGAGATAVTIDAGSEWDSGNVDADPEGNIIAAWNNIMDESNVDETEMNEVHLVYPAKVDGLFKGLRMIENVNQSLQKYLSASYGFKFHPSRYYDEAGSTKLQDDALMVVKSRETAFRMNYTGAAIPLSETQKLFGRGDEYLTKMIFGTKVVPYTKGATTSKRICKIANVI